MRSKNTKKMCFKGDVRRGYFKNYSENDYLLNFIIERKLWYKTINQID